MKSLLKPQEAMWSYLKEPGMEHLLLLEDSNLLWANGFILGLHSNILYRIKYIFRFDTEWKVREVRLESSGRINKNIDKFITEEGQWTSFFEDEDSTIAGRFAADISTSPVTRSLMLRQLSLSPGQSRDIEAASLDVLDLTLKPVSFRYTCLQLQEIGSLYRCENLSTGEKEELQLDPQGLLQDSTGILKRIWAG